MFGEALDPIQHDAKRCMRSLTPMRDRLIAIRGSLRQRARWELLVDGGGRVLHSFGIVLHPSWRCLKPAN